MGASSHEAGAVVGTDRGFVARLSIRALLLHRVRGSLLVGGG